MSIVLHIESFIPFPDDGRSKTRYIGEPLTVGVDDDQDNWTIYQFNYELTDDNQLRITDIKVRTKVAWTDRDTLDW